MLELIFDILVIALLVSFGPIGWAILAVLAVAFVVRQ